MRSTRLSIGQRLTIYPRKLNAVASSNSSKKTNSTVKKAIPKGDFNTYTVKSGDSLWLIAKKYANVSVQNIKDWNNIWSVKSLKPGTKLKIFNK